MTGAVETLVRETIELTGAQQPALLEDDAPVLSDDALSVSDVSFYLVGLIGGKDVGKSALVNALAGRNITATSSYGPGTESVIAYAHQSQLKALQALLEREVPGQYRIVTHELASFRRQVLLDLPDIDSHFAAHLQVTRTMLRHMLFPVWLASIEKYADRHLQQMLARVAAGNSPGNFVFCLNKVDQLSGVRVQGSGFGEADGPAAELRDDYAGRVQRTLDLDSPPRVYLISAISPQGFDLPALRALLSREKSPEAVRQSQDMATRRQEHSLMGWLDHQQLPQKARRLHEIQEDAEELAAQRIGQPLLDQVIPRLLDDPEARAALAEEVLTERVARWPVVRLVHTLLSPLFVLLRGATARNAAPLQSPEGMVAIVLRESNCSVSELVQTTFAQLRQSQPSLADLYTHNKLWEQMPADLAASALRRNLGATLERQRDAARTELNRGAGWGAPVRWLLTIGAVLWFPFIQPLLHAALGRPTIAGWTWNLAAELVVEVLGANYLLRSAGFLVLYFVALWLALRWNTQRKVARIFKGWRTASSADASLNLATRTLQWIDDLTLPIRAARDRMASLAARAEELRKAVGEAA